VSSEARDSEEPVRREIEPAGEVYDTSFEVNLDPDEDRPDPAKHKPVYVDATVVEHERRPIVPANLRTVAGIKATSKRKAVALGYHTVWHGVRVPQYTGLGLLYAPVGLLRVAWLLIAWWLDLRSLSVEQEAVTTGDSMTFFKARREGNGRRAFRGIVLATCLFTLVAAGTTLHVFTPAWVQAIVVLTAVPPLAHYGRLSLRAKPIVMSAVVNNAPRRINSDVVLRAYYAAGLGNPDKEDKKVEFGSRMSRDALDQGSEVTVILPYGSTFAEAMRVRDKIASGLDVQIQQVYLTKDRKSERTHKLYVTDVDPLAVPAGKTPLLAGKQTDIWQPAPFGLDERGRLVSVFLMWISILIGAQPRKGKTFSARLLALYAALDPYVRITIVDGKNSPDWKPFRLVAHMMVFGTVPNAQDDDPVEHLLQALRDIMRHIEQVNEFLSKLPLSECPEGKLTPALARRYPNLRVWMLVMEEFQLYYELPDKAAVAEIADLLSKIMAIGPSAGVILLGASQKPSGVGAGDVQRLFNRFRDNFAVRFALKCGNRIVSEAVLGGDAYSEGFDASALPIGKEYLGVGILYGLSDETPIVRTHLATGADAEKILAAARRHREAAGTLSGMAAGEDVAREFRDVLRDVHGVFYAGEAWISWAQIASRLAEQMPEHYADVTKESISAQLLSFKQIESKANRDPFDGGRNVRGALLNHVEAAIKSRELGSGEVGR
jgi:S-DNA-T family DNA segregation ATPase FtsK/SpoIIIE